jgi:carbamoyltransferase
MSTFYIGLSVTYHDSALAIVSEDGNVLFAEATERFLQNKRALNCEPDQLYRLPELLAQYCP